MPPEHTWSHSHGRDLARVLNVVRPSAENYISGYTRKLTWEKNTMYAVSVGKPCVRSQHSEYIQEFTLERSLTYAVSVEKPWLHQ